jgi:TolB-like protein/DNA-binding winged helix-turn-helix (wHTH) protein/Tfp pilus assembly protein PilF
MSAIQAGEPHSTHTLCSPRGGQYAERDLTVLREFGKFSERVRKTIQKAISRPVYEFGPFRLNPAEHQLLRDGRAVPLTPKVFDVLRLLVENSGHMLEKDELMKAVWPDSFVEEGNLTRNISTLRAVLGEHAQDHQYIETVPKRGYRFVAEVTEFDEDLELIVGEKTRARIVIDEEVQPGSNVRIVTGDQPALPTGRRLAVVVKRKVSIAVLAVLLLGLAVGLVHFTKPGEAIDSVAIMPFVNVSGDFNTEYLSDGLSDSIINNLSQLSNLKVISQSSTLRFKGKSIDPKQVGQELGVRAVLMGRLVQRGDDLSVSTELVDARDNTRLWAHQYNRKLADIMAMQEDISLEISERLRVKLNQDERKQLAKRYTENIEAYRAFLQGYHALLGGTSAAAAKSIESFDEAIRIDPGYAPAYAALARAYYKDGENFALLPEESRQKIESALRKALELDSNLADAHALLGTIKQDQGDWPEAEKEFKRAIEVNPNGKGVHWFYAKYLTAIGRDDEAIAEAKRGLEIDPLSPVRVAIVGYTYLCARKYDQAIEQYRKALEMDPNYTPAHINLARAFVQKGMYEQAISEFQKAMTTDPKRWGRIAGALAYAYAVAGRKAEAQKTLDDLSEQSKQGFVAPVNFAMIYSGLGDQDQAFQWLEKAYKDRPGPPYVQIDLIFDSLRSDPRFPDFARRKGLAL